MLGVTYGVYYVLYIKYARQDSYIPVPPLVFPYHLLRRHGAWLERHPRPVEPASSLTVLTVHAVVWQGPWRGPRRRLDRLQPAEHRGHGRGVEPGHVPSLGHVVLADVEEAWRGDVAAAAELEVSGIRLA